MWRLLAEQERTTEQVVDLPVPRAVTVILEVVEKNLQERISERIRAHTETNHQRASAEGQTRGVFEARELVCDTHPCVFSSVNWCRLDPSRVLEVGGEGLISRLLLESQSFLHLALFKGPGLADKT